MTIKEQLRAMVETLSEDDAALLVRALQGDRLAWTLLAAPIDDEPETDEERAAVEEAKAELARGEGVPWEDVKRELGL
jgi:hypothetical protein